MAAAEALSVDFRRSAAAASTAERQRLQAEAARAEAEHAREAADEARNAAEAGRSAAEKLAAAADEARKKAENKSMHLHDEIDSACYTPAAAKRPFSFHRQPSSLSIFDASLCCSSHGSPSCAAPPQP